MTSEYEKLLSLVSKINKCQGEKCLICHFPDKDENLIKLKCHHYFHFHCISSNNKLKENIKCPYCDRISKIIKNIDHCKYTLQKGPNKGKECGRNNCKYHITNPIINKLKINKLKYDNKSDNKSDKQCKSIIKYGPKKGDQCCRIDCGYHKSKNIIV